MDGGSQAKLVDADLAGSELTVVSDDRTKWSGGVAWCHGVSDV